MSRFARRTLSLLLVITMVAGMLPLGVFATEPAVPEQPTSVAEPVTPESSEPAPSESETPTESSEPAPSESETPAESSEPTPSESETPTESSEPTASEPETPTESSEPTASEPEEETTLPTEPQEDAPKGRAVAGGNEPYLTVFALDTNYETGYWEVDRSDEIFGFSLEGGCFAYQIYYYHTYDVDSDSWTSTPVIPEPGPNLTVTRWNDLENMETSGDDSAYYVRVSAGGTLDAVNTHVEYEDAKMEVGIFKVTAGFFTSETPSWDTSAGELQLDASKEENAVYWIYRGDGTPADVSLETWCPITGEMLQSYFGEGTDPALVTFNRVSDTVYKLTINPKLVTLSKYDDSDDSIFLSTEVSCTDADGNNLLNGISFRSNESILPRAQIEINDGVYYFYKDGAVWYEYWDEEGYDTVPVSVEGFAYTPDDEIKLNGVSYDYTSNTLTLENADLDALRLSSCESWEMDGKQYTDNHLPNNNLTLKLVGSNVIREELLIRDSAYVTLAGEGTLTMKGFVAVITSGTLDMTTNNKPILLDTGSYVDEYDDATILGDFQYAEGYTDLRVVYLDMDDNGCYYASPENEVMSTVKYGYEAEVIHPCIFYLYAWTDDGWEIEPVVPEPDENWTITSIPKEDIQNGAKDSDYYVLLRSQGTIDWLDATVSVEGVPYILSIGNLSFGFYTASEASVENLTPRQDIYTLSASGDNTIYLVENDTYGTRTIQNITWTLDREDLRDSDLYTVTEIKNGVYKVTFQDACKNYDDLILSYKIEYSFADSSSPETREASLAIVPPTDTGDSGSGDGGLILYAIWDERLEDESGNPILDENNNEKYVPVLHGPYTLEEYCLTGMHPQALLFYNKVMGENGWEMTPVVPETDDLVFTAYQGSFQHEDIDYVYNVTSNTLDGHPVTLTVGDKTYQWYVAPTPAGYFSGPVATAENYLKGDSQHFFDTTVDGDNTFYFIALAGNCGYTLNGNITWEFDTSGENYAAFMGLGPNEGLATITQLSDDAKGNKVWKITVSDAFVDYVKYSYNWKNFNLLISANWTYSDGNPGGIDGYGMFINPPQVQASPKAAFCINNVEYFIYDDAMFIRDWNKGGNIVKGSEEDYPEGVSYAVASNTMTLDNASLEMLCLEYDNSWEDEDGFHESQMLPSDTVKLNLVGENTLENDYANGIQLAGGANLEITGSGTLEIHVTNDFEQVPEEYGGGVARYSPVFLSGTSNLTIGGSASVTLVSDNNTETLGEWLFGIDSEGGTSSLTLKDSAKLNVQMPEGKMFKYGEDGNYGFLPIQTNHNSNSGLSAITIQDNAILTTDSMNLCSCVYTQTGGTWNLYTNPTDAENQVHDGLYTENATLNISGGAFNIIGRYAEVVGLEDYTFFGIQLTNGSQMNVSGGTVKINNCFNHGKGIVAYADEEGLGGTLNVTGGTIDLLSEKKNGQYFDALGVYDDPDASQFRMSGGTINAEGSMFPNSMYMEGGKINLTGLTEPGNPAIFQVASGYIKDGTIHISNATFNNIMNFSIDGGKIEIDNTENGTDTEYPMTLTGLRNELYLPINGGTITIQTAQAAAIENCATFHQMGGTITATSDTIAVDNSGKMLLNSGALELSGECGVHQWFDESLGGEDGGIFEPEFQVGGDTGDHNLTITGSSTGLQVEGGLVEFTGQAQVDITIPEDATGESSVFGITLYDGTDGDCPSSLTIKGGANVDIQCLRKDVDSIGLSSSSPVSIIGNQKVCPTLSIEATSAVCFSSHKEELDLLTMEGLGFVSTSSSRRLSSWSHKNSAKNQWNHYLLEGDVYATSVTTEPNNTFAEFSINPYTYRITEENGQQVVEVKQIHDNDDAYVSGEMPEGVAYDLATNTMTLSNKKAIDYLRVSYLTKGTDGYEKACLPTPDFTIRLKNKNTSLYMLTLDGQINATITGSGTLKLMDSASINGELTIAKGVTLVNDIALCVNGYGTTDYIVGGPAKLTVAKGATLTNNGLLTVDGQERSALDVQGKFSQGKNGQTRVGWKHRKNITGNIAQSVQTLICDITTEEALTAILAEETLSKYKNVWIDVSGVTLLEKHTIPKNTSLRVKGGCTLTIGENVDVTIAGTLALDEYDDCLLQNYGTLRIAKGGTMSMNGNFIGIAPVNEGGKITPQASRLAVTATDSGTSFDLFDMEDPTMTLTVAVTTKDTRAPLARVTWKSSNESIVRAADIADNQDGTYKVTFAGGVGKVTLTATTIDGAKKTATVTLTVAYLDGKLTAAQENSYSPSFLQVGETATMAVTVGEESLNALNAELETNVVTFKSSNAKVATVDPETGVITGIKPGTAKITATMAIPGDKRSVSITVKVVAPQILKLQLLRGEKVDGTVEKTEELYKENTEGVTTFDLASFENKAKELYIFPEALIWNVTEDANFEPAVANKLKWTCSDTGIATVKANKDYTTVTVKAKAHGVFTITATATDTNKAVATMTFIVKDYTPRLSNSSITLNPKLEGGVKLDLVESYGNKITDVWLEGKNAEKLTINSETYCVEAVLDEKGELKNQTIKPTLVADTTKGEYRIPLTVAVKNSTPKITVTQYGKLELSYRDSCWFDVTSSIGEVYCVKLAENSSPDILLEARYYLNWEEDNWDTEYDPDKEYEYVEYSLRTRDDCASKINTKVKLKVCVTGYQVPIDYSFTPKTTTAKITVTTNPAASVINGNAEEYTALFELKENGEYLWLWNDEEIEACGEDFEETYQQSWKAQVLKVTYNNKELPFKVVDNTIIGLTFSKDDYPKGFNGTVKVEIRDPFWSQHKTVSHKISTSTKAPSVTLERSTLNLYTLFPANYVSTQVRLNQSNLTLDNIDTPTCTNKEGQKLDIDVFVPEGAGLAYIGASFDKDEDGNYTIPKDGTYTFNSVAYYTDPVTEATKAVKFSFKVKVTSASPNVKLSSNTIKLNTALAGNEEENKASLEEGYVYAKITYNDAWSLSNNGYFELAGYEVDGNEVLFGRDYYRGDTTIQIEATTYEDAKNGIRFRGQQYYQDALYNEPAEGVLLAELTRATATKHTYTVYPIVYEYNTDQFYTLSKNKLSLTVQPHSGKLSVSQSASGKLDLLTMDTPVIYTIKKVNNAYCDDLQVTLLKKDGKDYVPYETDEEGYYNEEPLFDLYAGGIIQSGRNYQAVYLYLNPNYTYTAGKTEQFKLRYTIGDVSFDSPVLSLKINRSTPKITASTVNYYHAEGAANKTVQLNLTKPAGAYIKRVELNEKKTSKELLAAMEEIDLEENWDGESSTLTIRVENPGALKAGKSYNLYLDVYPFTPLQTSEKPTTIKVTVKVAK